RRLEHRPRRRGHPRRRRAVLRSGADPVEVVGLVRDPPRSFQDLLPGRDGGADLSSQPVQRRGQGDGQGPSLPPAPPRADSTEWSGAPVPPVGPTAYRSHPTRRSGWTGRARGSGGQMTINERAPEGDRSYAAVADRLTMPLVEAMETQRAVRRILPDPVDDDIVLRCIELGLKAPTGSNGQNWQFV